MGVKRVRLLLYPGLLLLCVGLVIAEEACPAIVETALDAVDELCQDAGRNQACYGNVSLSAEPQPGVSDFQFEQYGDIVDVADISTLKLEPMNEAEGVWGLVLMRLQADIPDSLPGQNVTFLLFGDVELDNAVTPDDTTQSPMQAFYLKTGVSDSACEEAPDSGLLVQTPDGIETVSFNINGVDVEVGSTVLFQAQPDDEMIISPVEGSAVVSLEGESYPTIAGTRMRIPMGGDLRPNALPPLPEAYETRDVQGLPVHLLPRGIDIQAPLGAEDVQQFHDRLNNGKPPCGEAPFPPCKGALHPDHFRPPPPGNQWGAELPPRPARSENLPLGGNANIQPPGGNQRPAGSSTQTPGNQRPAGNTTQTPGENNTNQPDGNQRPGSNVNRPGGGNPPPRGTAGQRPPGG